MKKILLVDDDEIVIKILKQKIELIVANVTIDTASDFGNAIILSSSNSYELAIIDNILSYPGEGEDLAKQIILFPKNVNAELWIISGDFSVAEQKNNMKYVPKPTDESREKEFIKSINEWYLKNA